jgi:hypothetical protein
MVIAARGTFPIARVDEGDRKRFKALRYSTAIRTVLVSRGGPILTADCGGAQEIAEHAAFISAAGFWQGEIRVSSMDERFGDLMQYYCAGASIG